MCDFLWGHLRQKMGPKCFWTACENAARYLGVTSGTGSKELTMYRRRLGASEPKVGAIGLGCMPMTDGYGPAHDEEAVATIQRAIDRGVTFFDTADIYGHGQNEELVGRALDGRRNGVVLATKFVN